MLLPGGRVVAAAMARVELDASRMALEEAGLRVIGADVRSAGIAALLGEVPEAGAVAAGRRTTEIVIAERGVPVFARAFDAEAAMGDPEERGPDRIAARAAVEVKRTLTSARAVGVSPEWDRVTVIGGDDLAERIRAACELELGLSGDGPAAEVRWPEGVGAAEQRALAPLAGVALRRAIGLDGIDFVRPHRAPDRNARKRQLALAGVFAAVTIVGLVVLAARSHLAVLEARRDTLRETLSDKHAQWLKYRATDARVAHAQVWASANEDWLAEALWVTRTVPDSDQVVLDELSGKMSVWPSFVKGKAWVYPGQWAIDRKATVHISGRAGSRDRALELRGDLLESGRYHVLTLGPDAGDRFTLDLVNEAKREVTLP